MHKLHETVQIPRTMYGLYETVQRFKALYH